MNQRQVELNNLVTAVEGWYQGVVREAFQDQREALIAGLVAMIRTASFQAPGGVAQVSDTAAWQPIESLSMLRQIVGGRFQNLRDRWVNAGFPLREHRGDRGDGSGKISETGWIELEHWIQKQGFEVRRTQGAGPVLFEVKKQAAVRE